MNGKIIKVSGPLIVAENLADVEMFDVVKVSDKKLIGEVIELRNDRASIQVYEETGGLTIGDEVVSTGAPLSVELAPGLIESIFDGIQRPLDVLMDKSGSRIGRGIEVNSLDRGKKWHFVPVAKVGDRVVSGDVLGTVQETKVVLHKIMVPYGVEGEVKSVAPEGDYTIMDVICKVGDRELTMLQKWPVRIGRPYEKKYSPPAPPCAPASGSSTPCSPSPRAAPPPSPAPSAPARPWCSTSWPSGPTWTSSSTWAAASAATR